MLKSPLSAYTKTLTRLFEKRPVPPLRPQHEVIYCFGYIVEPKWCLKYAQEYTGVVPDFKISKRKWKHELEYVRLYLTCVHRLREEVGAELCWMHCHPDDPINGCKDWFISIAYKSVIPDPNHTEEHNEAGSVFREDFPPERAEDMEVVGRLQEALGHDEGPFWRVYAAPHRLKK